MQPLFMSILRSFIRANWNIKSPSQIDVTPIDEWHLLRESQSSLLSSLHLKLLPSPPLSLWSSSAAATAMQPESETASHATIFLEPTDKCRAQPPQPQPQSPPLPFPPFRPSRIVRSLGRSFAFGALKKGSAMQLMIPTREACVLLISTCRFMLIAFSPALVPRLSAKSKTASRQYFPRFQAATHFHYSATSHHSVQNFERKRGWLETREGGRTHGWPVTLNGLAGGGPARGNAVRKHTYTCE